MGEKLIVIVKTLRSQMGLPAQLSKHSYHTTKKIHANKSSTIFRWHCRVSDPSGKFENYDLE